MTKDAELGYQVDSNKTKTESIAGGCVTDISSIAGCELTIVDTQIDCSVLQCQCPPDRLRWVASKYGVEVFGTRRSPDNWETCEPRS